MNPLPTPPTDNLYKFMALTGTWLMIFLLAFYAWLLNADYEIRLEGRQLQAFVSAQASLREIQVRLLAIREGRHAENIVSWVQKDWPLEQEVRILSSVAVSNGRIVDEYQKSNHGKLGEIFDRLSSMGFLWFIVPYVGGAVALTYSGYRLWYRRVQIPNESMARVELELKVASVRKLELEIKQTRRVRFARKAL